MGTIRRNEAGAAGLLQWVRMPMGEYRWTGGPVVCAETDSGGWMVELSKHSELGRRTLPLAGPFDGLGEAKVAASRLVFSAKRQKLRRVGGLTPKTVGESSTVSETGGSMAVAA